MAVQKRIANLRWQSEGVFPRLIVIDTGILAGYVVINPKWGGFSLDDYRNATGSVLPTAQTASEEENETVTVEKGAFDLRGYQVIHGQWINGQNDKIAISMTSKRFRFSTAAVTRYGKDAKVEILLNIDQQMLAVRKAEKDSRYALTWTTVNGSNKVIPRDMLGTAFLPVLYELFGWKEDCRYVIEGEYKKKDDEEVLLFKGTDAVLVTTRGELTGNEGDSTQVCAYPKKWVSSLGTPYYSHAKESQDAEGVQQWNVSAEGKEYKHPEDTTDPEHVRKQINEIIGQLEKEKEKVNYSGNS